MAKLEEVDISVIGGNGNSVVHALVSCTRDAGDSMMLVSVPDQLSQLVFYDCSHRKTDM